MIFDELCDAVVDLMPKIHALPFNRELANGSLPLEKFIHYLIQDAFYLEDFSKALTLTVSKLTQCQQIKRLIQLTNETTKVEREFHCTILQKHKLDTGITHKKSQSCLIYTNYLQSIANTAPVEEAVASLLPCFWVYQQVWQHLAMKKTANNPYQSWINLYSNPSFNIAVNSIITIANELGSTATARTKKSMITSFRHATQLEQYFWEETYIQATSATIRP